MKCYTNVTANHKIILQITSVGRHTLYFTIHANTCSISNNNRIDFKNKYNGDKRVYQNVEREQRVHV